MLALARSPAAQRWALVSRSLPVPQFSRVQVARLLLPVVQVRRWVAVQVPLVVAVVPLLLPVAVRPQPGQPAAALQPVVEDRLAAVLAHP